MLGIDSFTEWLQGQLRSSSRPEGVYYVTWMSGSNPDERVFDAMTTDEDPELGEQVYEVRITRRWIKR